MTVPSIPEEDKEMEGELEENIRINRLVKKRPIKIPEGGKALKGRRMEIQLEGVQKVDVEQGIKTTLMEDELVAQEHHRNQQLQQNQEKAFQKDGRLRALRKRMEEEKRNVLIYMEKKKEMEIITDIGTWWAELEKKQEGKAKERKEKAQYKQDWVPEGWMEWWKMTEMVSEKDGKQKRLSKAKEKQKYYQEESTQTLYWWVGEAGGQGWRLT